MTSLALDVTRADKPLDVGNGRVVASIGLAAQVQALSAFHPTHGSMVLTTESVFPDDRRFDVAAVRRHRSELADPHGAGLTLGAAAAWEPVAVELRSGAIPVHELTSADVRAVVTTWAPVRPRATGLVQTWELGGVVHDRPARVSTRLAGVGRLGRAGLTQLTEGGVLPMPDPATMITRDAATVVVAAVGLPAVAIVRVDLARGATLVPLAEPGMDVILAPGDEVTLVLRVALGPSEEQARHELEALMPDTLASTVAARHDRRRMTLDSVHVPADDPLDPLVTRAIDYPRSCCTVEVGATTAMLTDHRILPLAWTRDAYWACTALAETDPDGAGDLVRRHLAWLYDVADRPDGWWARSYLPTGAVKDPAWQLDQQCYPVLEVLDHVRRRGDVATLQRWAPAVRDVLERLLARRHESGLLATDETPADDPLDLQFHLSSNLLVAHVLRRVAVVAEVVDLAPATLVEAADRTVAAINRHFTMEIAGRRCLAYATDLSSVRWYHDANDVPTVLAPRWGLGVPVETWRATMELAFSRHNPEGFVNGPRGGLGSIHTPGAWPLGDAQELMYAAWVGDRPRSAEILRRLVATTTWDGSLPECRDPETGAVRSRHWFAWPGCLVVLGLQMLNDPRGGDW